MVVQFLPDPLDVGLDKRNEVKVRVEQFGKILFGIVAVIRNNLRFGDAEYLKLL